MLKFFNFSKIFVLISALLLADYYIILPSLIVRAFSFALLFMIYIFFINPFFSKSSMSGSTKAVVFYGILFITYTLISDVIKNDPIESFKDWIVNILIILMLPIFEDNVSKFNTLSVYSRIVACSMLLAVFQIFGLGHNLNTLIPDIGIIKSNQMIDPATISGYRVSGANFSVIAFAENVAVLMMLLYFLLKKAKKLSFIIAIGISVFILFYTQTRAAIFSIIPAIFISEFFIEKISPNSIIKRILLGGIIYLALFLSTEMLETKFTYVFRDIETHDTHRFEINYYMVKAVWEESPIFGIPKRSAWDMFFKYAEMPQTMMDYLSRSSHDTPTHHNQLAYYFRYYGLTGIALLTFLYISIYKKIVRSRCDNMIKLFLLSVFIFDLLYSMGHNNKVAANEILWILLSSSDEKVTVS